jgi:hypothetical protein
MCSWARCASECQFCSAYWPWLLPNNSILCTTRATAPVCKVVCKDYLQDFITMVYVVVCKLITAAVAAAHRQSVRASTWLLCCVVSGSDSR